VASRWARQGAHWHLGSWARRSRSARSTASAASACSWRARASALNVSFGARLGARHPNCFGTGELYRFYELRLQ